MIIQGDALQWLRLIPSGSVDLIITDPPYQKITGGSGEDPNHKRPTGILAANDGRFFPDNEVEFDDYMADLFRVLRDPAHMYLMVDFTNLETAMASVRRAGFDIHNLLVWVKQNATPNRWYMKNCEYVIFARKGRAFAINDCGSKTAQSFPNPIGAKLHPTEKSIAQMAHWIENSSQPGETVLDPFCGSGTTGAAAVRLGRKFIGFEINPEFVRIARGRVDPA